MSTRDAFWIIAGGLYVLIVGTIAAVWLYVRTFMRGWGKGFDDGFSSATEDPVVHEAIVSADHVEGQRAAGREGRQ